jgi:hypothetical protein
MTWKGRAMVTVSLVLAMAVELSGCITINPPAKPASPPEAEAPAPEVEAPVSPPVVPPPAPPQEASTLPDSLEDFLMQGWHNQIVVLECPTEARVGEHITVRLRIGSDEFWNWLRQELINTGEYDTGLPSVWLDPYFSLYLQGRGLDIAYFGQSKLDDNNEAWWYAVIPEKTDLERPIEPGVYPLIVEIGEALGSVDVIFERNIIIKE